VAYQKPSRLNSVTITLLLILLAGGYWMWRFFPAYLDAWTVDHVLKETATALYRANRLSEPLRTNELNKLVTEARAEIVKKAGVTDPELSVGLEIDGENATVTATYKVIVTHLVTKKTTTLNMKRSEKANVKAVKWD
jgi:hypothetical protein